METKINEKDQLFEKDNLSGENQGALLPNQMGRYLTASSLDRGQSCESGRRASGGNKRNYAGSRNG